MPWSWVVVLEVSTALWFLTMIKDSTFSCSHPKIGRNFFQTQYIALKTKNPNTCAGHPARNLGSGYLRYLLDCQLCESRSLASHSVSPRCSVNICRMQAWAKYSEALGIAETLTLVFGQSCLEIFSTQIMYFFAPYSSEYNLIISGQLRDISEHNLLCYAYYSDSLKA